MSRVRLLLAAALLALAAFVGLRALTAPEPYATLAREAGATTGSVAGSGAPAGPAAAAARSGGGPPAAVAGPREPPSPALLRAALAALDRARAAGYADPVAADPDAWAARSCPCRATDARRLRALAARGLALRGHRTTVRRVVFARAGPASAVLLVTDRVGAYAAVDGRGRTVARWPASAPRTWRVTLVRVAGRWLLGEVARAP